MYTIYRVLGPLIAEYVNEMHLRPNCQHLTSGGCYKEKNESP
jgi:hypothetical protein